MNKITCMRVDRLERSLVREGWQELYADTERIPFLSWEWMSSWHSKFGSGSEPFIVLAYRGRKLVGIVPFRRVTRSFLGLRVAKLAFLGQGEGAADHLDLIARPEDKRDVAEACAQYLREHRIDLVNLNDLSPTSAIASVLQKTLPRGSSFVKQDGHTCPRLDLTQGWDRVLNNCRRRNNFRRRLKQLQADASFEFRSVTARAELSDAFERFLTLHSMRRPGSASAITGDIRHVAFHRGLIDQMRHTGVLRFDEIWANGACRASVYGFDSGHTFYYYNTGFDPEWARKSVGLVLMGLSIRAAVERGVRVYDLLRGDEAYKFDWATEVVPLTNITVAGDTLAARLSLGLLNLSTRAKQKTKLLLPDHIADALRRARSSISRREAAYEQ